MCSRSSHSYPESTDFLLLVGLSLVLAGCSAPTDTVEVWADSLGGRQLRYVGDQYVIYAKSQKLATDLQRPIDQDMAAFEDRLREAPVKTTGVSSNEPRDDAPRGLVLAIEPGEEPISEIERWRVINVDRRRQIEWPERPMGVSTDQGRPYIIYAFDLSPPFIPVYRESFAMPVAVAEELLGLPESHPKLAWVLFLTSNEHVRERFEERLRAGPRSVSIWGPLMMMYWRSKQKSIDVALAGLQRRETLWYALVDQRISDAAVRSEWKTRIRDEIDQAWKQLWLSRPFD